VSVGSHGRTIFVADAHRDDRKRFVVRADEKLAAFVELESANWLDKLARFFKTRRRQTDLNQAEDISPARFFASSGPAIAE